MALTPTNRNGALLPLSLDWIRAYGTSEGKERDRSSP